MLNQKVLFTKEEIYKIRNYVTDLKIELLVLIILVINEGKHDSTWWT